MIVLIKNNKEHEASFILELFQLMMKENAISDPGFNISLQNAGDKAQTNEEQFDSCVSYWSGLSKAFPSENSQSWTSTE